MFWDHEDVAKWPHNGDEDNYFPTIIEQGSIDYGTNQIDLAKVDEIYKINELKFAYNTLDINDWSTSFTE